MNQITTLFLNLDKKIQCARKTEKGKSQKLTDFVFPNRNFTAYEQFNFAHSNCGQAKFTSIFRFQNFRWLWAKLWAK